MANLCVGTFLLFILSFAKAQLSKPILTPLVESSEDGSMSSERGKTKQVEPISIVNGVATHGEALLNSYVQYSFEIDSYRWNQLCRITITNSEGKLYRFI